jgi:protein kinase-like protein
VGHHEPIAIGARLGPYEILGPIGRGGMGEVYRARDARLGREVAVKVLPADAGQMPDRLPRFEREAQAVAALNHPNILALHDIGNEAGVVYAVMELLEGDTLRVRLKQAGRFTPLKAIDYAIQIARGLAAAHERGIVHRDLKPENIFITRDSQVKILDFGLARQETAQAIDGDGRATRFATEPGVLLGTPGYVAPEQILGGAATARSDLFSLGIVLYEMLAGAHPFRRATITDTITAILREDPPSLDNAVPGLPAGIAKIVERCLDKHPADRPASARDLGLFLEAAGTNSARVPSGGTIGPNEVRRVRDRILAISCALLVLLSMAIWGFVRVMADQAVTSAIEADLTRAERLVHRVQRDRLATLALTARLVASFPELKALFATDAATVRDYLVSYQQRNPEVPLLVALDPEGKVLARTDEVSAGSHEAWIGSLARPEEPAVVQIRDRPYHAAAAVADAGGNVFGHVVAAMPIDAAFAAALREATQDEVILLSDSGVLASTLRGANTPWRSRDEWRRAGGRPDRSTDVDIGAQRFAAREVVLAEKPPLSVVILKSRDEAIEPFRRIQSGIALIGLLCAVVAAAGSVWIARTAISGLQRSG